MLQANTEISATSITLGRSRGFSAAGFLTGAAILAGCFMAAGPRANAARLDFSNREVPFQVTDDAILTGSAVMGAGSRLSQSADLQLDCELSSQSASHLYAIILPLGNDADTVNPAAAVSTSEYEGISTVTVNGQPLYLTPVPRHNALVWRVDSGLLKAGQNTFQFERATTSTWSDLTMFSLQSASEDVHFGQAFGEAAAVSGGSATRDIAPAPAQENYDVLWYDCTWSLDAWSTQLKPGSMVTVGARALTALNSMVLDFDLGGYSGYNGSMTIDSIDSGPGTSALTYTNLASYDAPRIRVNLPQTFAAGSTFQVRIAYHGTPNTYFPKKIFGRDAFYSKPSINNGGPLVYSESQPYGGRRWWPCKDHPSDKATTTIQRIIVPNNSGYNLSAVSNGKLEQTINHGATTEYVWVNGYPIATYLVSVAMSNYVYFEGPYTSRDGQTTMPVGAYILPQDTSFEGNGYLGTIQVMNFLADTFGEYPFLNEKYVTASWGDSFAIEHQTCTSMPAHNTDGLYTGLTRRNVHEMTHQWYGDKLSISSWDHLWLNEGFATYAEALWNEHNGGMASLRSYMAGWNVGSGPVVGPLGDTFNNGNQYTRAGWVVHMLRFVLGDAKFFKMLKDYAAQDYANTTSQPGDPNNASIHFQTVVEQSAGLPAGSMKPFFDQWLYGTSKGPDYASQPTFAYSAAYDVLTSSVAVNMLQTQKYQPFHMPVPLRLTAADSSTTDIIVPAGVTQTVIPLGSFRPVSFTLDPDAWMLKSAGLRATSIDLPQAATGLSYSFALGSGNNTGTASWNKSAGTPAWLSVSSGGLLSGTPPAPGVYPVNLQLSNTAGTKLDISYRLQVADTNVEPPARVVINEFSYESRGTIKSGEFVELLNTDSISADIGGWRVVVVRASGSAAVTVTIPAGTTLAPGQYFVLGNAAAINAVYPGAVNLDTGWNDSLPDDAPGAIVLESSYGSRVDSVAYRSDVAFGSGSYASIALAEGGTGRSVSWSITDTASNFSMGRLPNGQDTQSNIQDFALIPPSPGAANSSGVVLPFTDDFTGGPRPEWRDAFTAPVRTATPGASGKPPVAAPAPGGGDMLEVYDPTGGGDVAFLPGAFDKLNFEGLLWIPQDEGLAPWSVGVGIDVRAEAAWFSDTRGYSLSNGFYLEYQNGSGVNLASSQIPNSPGAARFFGIDGSNMPGGGTLIYTPLGATVSPSAGSWQPFQLIYDRPGNRLMAKLAGATLYDGPIPVGGYNLAGGVCVGFRENHSGNINASKREGTWIDHVRVDTNTGSAVADYQLYD